MPRNNTLRTLTTQLVNLEQRFQLSIIPMRSEGLLQDILIKVEQIRSAVDRLRRSV